MNRFALLWFCFLLAACSATAAESPPAPTSIVLPTAVVVAPTNPSVPNATTHMPTVAPTFATEPTPTEIPATAANTPVLPRLQAIYGCEHGFCTSMLDDPQSYAELIPTSDSDLHGYAYTPDGTQIVYAGFAYPPYDYEIVLANSKLGDPKSLAMIHGIESGSGDIEGFGIIGVSADGKHIIYENEARLSVMNIDGSNPHPILEERPYGASSTHRYQASPSGQTVLYTATGSPSSFELIDVASGSSRLFDLSNDRHALALVDDAHVLVERFEPPIDPNQRNPAAAEHFTIGYDVVSIEGETLGAPVALAEDDGSYGRMALSNVADDWIALMGNGPRVDSMPAQSTLWLLNIRNGARLPISLPGYDGISPIALSIAP